MGETGTIKKYIGVGFAVMWMDPDLTFTHKVICKLNASENEDYKAGQWAMGNHGFVWFVHFPKPLL